MRTIGIITTWIVGLAAVAAIAVGLRSASDAKRYLRMRQM
jgi:hypothetical protein